MYLWVILQYDSNIHVDNNEKTDDKIWQQECNANCCRPTVAWIAQLIVRLATLILIHDAIQHAIPSSRRWHLIAKFRKITIRRQQWNLTPRQHSVSTCKTRQYNSVTTAISLVLDNPGVGFQAEVRHFPLLHNIHTGSEVHPAFYLMSTMDYFPKHQAARIWLTIHLNLFVRSTISGAVFLLPHTPS